MGEITQQDTFGSCIINTVRKYGINNILEIGSADGTGSTQCFIEALQYLPKRNLVCMEPRPEPYAQLVKNVAPFSSWVTTYNNCSISYDNLSYKNFDEFVWENPYNKLVGNADKELVRKWYQDDIEMFKNERTAVLEKIIPTLPFAGVLIDGSEFSGYDEFRLIKDRTNFIFMDDCTRAFKTNRVLHELNNDPDWGILIYEPNYRNGYAIARRKTLKMEFYL